VCACTYVCVCVCGYTGTLAKLSVSPPFILNNLKIRLTATTSDICISHITSIS
jgi:hypothetical protein